MTHYVCTGECGGVSEVQKNCGDETCSKHGQPLTPCECDGAEHSQKQKEEEVAEHKEESKME